MARRALRKLKEELDLSRHLLFPAPVSLGGISLPVRSEADTPGDLPASAGSTLPPVWDSALLFGRRAPVEIEVGSGKGLFLARGAAERPEHDFLGIELAKKYAYHVAARLAQQSLANARILCGDGLAFFRYLPDDTGLTAVHVYFPDPWWKKRHHKRRVMNAPFVRDIERTLAAGGSLHFWTDVEEYFLETLTLLAAETKLAGPLSVAERPAADDLDYQTHFERRTRLSEQPVYRAKFRKSSV